jgi:hypothetical protein
LAQGHDSRNLRILAGLTPPYNHFELSERRDWVLNDLGIVDLDRPEAIRTFTVELLTLLIAGEAEMSEALGAIAQLCTDDDYPSDLMDFYHLYHAYIDLIEFGEQYEWYGASPENIKSIVLERAASFVSSQNGPA